MLFFRSNGKMYLQVGDVHWLIDNSVIVAISNPNPNQVLLHIRCNNCDCLVIETVPGLLLSDPCLDDVELQFSLWTYSVYSAMVHPKGLSHYWGCSGWE